MCMFILRFFSPYIKLFLCFIGSNRRVWNFKKTLSFLVFPSLYLHQFLLFSSSVLVNTELTFALPLYIGDIKREGLEWISFSFFCFSCDWTRPKKRSTKRCWCSCSRNWSSSMLTRVKLRSTPTPSTIERSRIWNRGFQSAEHCWNRGLVPLNNHCH